MWPDKDKWFTSCRSAAYEIMKIKMVHNKNFMVPFYGWGSTASKTTEPLRGGSLLFITKIPEGPGTHFINLGRMKG